MKTLSIVVAASVLSVWAVDSRAQVQRLPIAVSGTAQTSKTSKVKITNADLVSTVNNQMVIAIDLSNNFLAIEEWDSTLSNAITNRAPASTDPAAILANFRMAVIADSSGKKVKFNSNLEANTADWDGDGFRDTESELLVDATASLATNGVITRLSGKLTGVMNDREGTHQGSLSTNGYRNVQGTLLWNGNALFKGTIKSTGPVF